jgi:hypothetical protein
MFLDTDIGENRLDNGQASGIDLFALRGVYLGLHFIDQVWLVLINPDGEIAARGVWFAQTPGSQGASSTIFLAGLVNVIGTIAIALVGGSFYFTTLCVPDLRDLTTA